MSSRTGQQVEDDVFAILRNSSLASEIRGTVYHRELRPRESQAEDAVVIFVAGLPGDDIETGTVLIQIFVQDEDAYGTGQLVPATERLTELEQFAAQWVEKLKKMQTETGYQFSLADTIHTAEFAEKNQHFVAIRLKYKALTLNN